MTNYAMLEFLLLRKLDRVLFDQRLQFLVLDEVHTYHGARGIEVACLIRRLKEHVGKLDGALACIGTSATVKGEELRPVWRASPANSSANAFRPSISAPSSTNRSSAMPAAICLRRRRSKRPISRSCATSPTWIGSTTSASTISRPTSW
jgi:hypothetical protein